MKTIIYIQTLLAITLNLTVKSQNTAEPNVKTEKVNLHVVQHSKTQPKHKILPVLGSVNKTTDITVSAPAVLSFNELKQKAENLIQQSQLITENALKFKDDNRIMQLEIALQLQKEAYTFQQKALEISLQNALADFNFNKIEFFSLIKTLTNSNSIVDYCKLKHAEAESDFSIAKEMLQEAYAMPTLAGRVGTMVNAEEKEYLALKKQSEAIEKLKSLVMQSSTLKKELLCAN